ncbi:MAG: hypothetical protein ABI237_10745 [Ginsengibacter sp.]
MVAKDDILNLPLTENEIIDVIKKAKDKINISKFDNLRERHANIQFDCILRGYIGEFVIRKWLLENGIVPEKTNYVPNGDSIDIDFYYRGKNVELKTSLIPDADITIDNVIKNRDIKLIKREERIEELRGDIHMQIYYSQKRKSKDDWLSSQDIHVESDDYKYLYEAFLAKAYKETTFFVAWIDKPSLVAQINVMPENQRTWSFKDSKRLFWNCKIRDAKRPEELISYLKALK